MRNSDTHCSISGTSALQMKQSYDTHPQGIIIEFPQTESFRTPSDPAQGTKVQGESSFFNSSYLRTRLMQSEMFYTLRYGSMKGSSCNKLKTWQVVFAGCLFTALAFGTLFSTL